MIKTLKKLTSFILFLGTLYLIDGVFLPSQEQFYTSTDIRTLQEDNFYIIILIEILLILLLLYPFFLKLKKSKDLFSKKTALIILYLSIYSFIFFSFFQSAFIASYLYINKLSDITELKNDYEIISKKTKDNHYYLSWLYNEDKEEILFNDIEISQSDYLKLKKGDIVSTQFKVGCLGIKYSPSYPLEFF